MIGPVGFDRANLKKRKIFTGLTDRKKNTSHGNKHKFVDNTREVVRLREIRDTN